MPIVFRNHQAIKTLLSLEKMSALPRFLCCHLLSCLSWLCVFRLGAVQGNKSILLQPNYCNVYLLIPCNKVKSKSPKGTLVMGTLALEHPGCWMPDLRLVHSIYSPALSPAPGSAPFSPTYPQKVKSCDLCPALQE